MRSYCAVHVDVGYLLASAATYVTGSSLRRSVTVDYPTLIARLVEQAQADSDLPLLRVNWYDSGARPGGMPDYQQEAIGLLPRVKLRLGRLSYSGDQKGVDIRIGLDLAIQGRNRVADVVYLVSGDDDLTEAVEEAQSHGVQVVLLAVPDHQGRPHGVSKHLRREVDGLLLIDAETVESTVRPTAIPEELLPEGARGEVAGGEEVEEVAADGDQAAAAELEDAATSAPTPVTGTPTSSAPEVAEPEPPAASAPLPTAPPVPSPPHHATDPERPADAPAPQSPPGPRPSPAVFARRKATTLTLPGAGVPEEVPFDPEVGVTPELVDSVARRLVATWCRTATPEQLTELGAARPTIPAELDRALLVDLGSRTQGAHLSDDARQHLRDRFWLHVGRVRLG